MKHDLFISYSRRNFDEVNSFIELLKSRIPALNIWFDINGIESGDEFEDKIISAIDNSAYILFALSDAALESKWTKDEVMYAKNTDKKVIPLLLKGAVMKGWFLFKFGRIDCIDITNELQVDKLVNNLCSWTGKEKNHVPRQVETEQIYDSQEKENVAETATETATESVTEPATEMETAAEPITPEDLCDYGENFYYGKNGVSQDYAEAVKWYKKAAEQGYAYAQYIVGFCFEYGQGVSLDYNEAVKWYSKAAEQGNTSGMYELGLCYDYGRGVFKDMSLAKYWFQKAADKGHLKSKEALERIYRLEIQELYKKGRDYYKQSNYAEAVKYFRQAAEKGVTDAQNSLGYCYERGKGVEMDYSEAIKWYRKAAEQGNSSGMYNLGTCYQEGNGVSRDLSIAKYWYQKAADKGHSISYKKLGEIIMLEKQELRGY